MEMRIKEEIEKLVSFLPRLYAEGFEPIREWGGLEKDSRGYMVFPFPRYDVLVREFFEIAGSAFWADYDYDPEKARNMLEDEKIIKKATLDEIKTMLTYCVRGERFASGHWASMIKGGYIRRLLERLAEIGGEYT